MKKELLDIAGNSNQKGSNDLPRKKDSTTIEPYVGSTEVAGFLGISPRMLRNAVKKGLPAYEVGSRLYFRLSQVEAWVQGRRSPVEELKPDSRRLGKGDETAASDAAAVVQPPCEVDHPVAENAATDKDISSDSIATQEPSLI